MATGASFGSGSADGGWWGNRVDERHQLIAAGQRHDLVRREPARRRAAHPLEAAWLDGGFADPAQESAAVRGDLEIDLAAGLMPERSRTGFGIVT